MKRILCLVLLCAVVAWPQTANQSTFAGSNAFTTSKSVSIQLGGKEMAEITEDGKVTFFNGYMPDETAKQFWKALGANAPNAPQQSLPAPEWVPDPSAGHYDCPDGWTASVTTTTKVEPEKYHSPYEARILPSIIYPPPTLDKKGHVLGTRPAPPICVKDKP